jgi:hypothetical protein|tara:strand:- start:856 stop:1518 length:663 start_codon:yes stop_codon:yes gene_type:complete
MNTVKLITEANDFSTSNYIIEQKEDGKKDYKIKGIFMQSNIKNRNGRVYPREVLMKEVKNYDSKFIQKNRAFGELGHPDGPTVNLDRVSHMITSLKPEGDNFIGEAKIMSTPMGEIVKSLMDEGATLGVSSRGMGSLDQRGGVNYVKNDFKLATAGDIVADPSAPSAFVEGIMEGKEWVWDHGSLVEAQVYEMKERIEKRVRARQNKEQALEFAKFLKML